MVTWLWGRLPLPNRARTFIIWLLSPKYTVGVLGLVRDEQGRILVLKHTYRPSEPWGLPGGGLRPGETLQQCLKREIREEAGIEVEIGDLLSTVAHPDRKLLDVIFACRPRAGQSLATFRPNAEISEARFVDPGDLPGNIARGQRRVLKLALSRRHDPGTFQVEPKRGEMP